VVVVDADDTGIVNENSNTVAGPPTAGDTDSATGPRGTTPPEVAA